MLLLTFDIVSTNKCKMSACVCSGLTTDCVSHVAADQAGAVFLARVEDGGRVETSVPGARQQFLRGVKTGLLELFLLGVSIHEGSYEPGAGGCQVEHSTMEGGLQIIKASNCAWLLSAAAAVTIFILYI